MRLGPPVAVGSALALIAGCGSVAATQPTSGPEVVVAVVEALEDAGSTHIDGNTAYGDDFELLVQGDAAVGTVGMGADYDAPFVAVGGSAYLLPPDNFWPEAGASGDEAARLRDRYVILSADAWQGDLPGSLTDLVEHFLPAPDEVADDIGRAEIDGRPVLVLTAADGVELSVDTEAPYQPVRLVLPADEEAMAYERVLLFSGFGEQRTVRAPGDPVPQEEIDG